MPRQLTNTNLLHLTAAAAVIHEVAIESPSLMHSAALQHAHRLITAVTNPPTEPGGAATKIGDATKAPPKQLPPPDPAIRPASPPPTAPTPKRLRSHDAAVKANATRKANARHAAALAGPTGAVPVAQNEGSEPTTL